MKFCAIFISSLDLRNEDGDFHKTSTLESIRYGLNIYKKVPPHFRKIDIIKIAAFCHANESLKSAMLKLKAVGKVETDHKQVISAYEREKKNAFFNVYKHTRRSSK